MANGNSSKGLGDAKKDKKYEFYTRLTDIEKELKHYKEYFAGKTVMCNCDDPYESNFFKYFAMNFNFLKLKKLIATSYVDSPIAYTQLNLFEEENEETEEKKEKKPYKVKITEVTSINGDENINLADVEYLLKNDKNALKILEGGDGKYLNGDFRSQECLELLKEADVIVTNPPFGLFREFISVLTEYNKDFIIIGNTNALSYKEVFDLFMKDKIRTGYTNFNTGMYFNVPDDYKYQKIIDGKKCVRVASSCWFTNLPVSKHNDEVPLYRKYDPAEYPTYDNYDAIEVNDYREIPSDYDGVMGLPITFLDKWNPKQFELLGMTSGRYEYDKLAQPTKRYINAIQHNKDGSVTSGSKANTRATIKLDSIPEDTIYYTADNQPEPLKIVYARVLIRRK